MPLGVFGGMIAAALIAVFYVLWHAIGPLATTVILACLAAPVPLAYLAASSPTISSWLD
jgi:hypothetical protein